MPAWSVELTGPSVATIRVEYKRQKSWEQWALLTSDRHLDNPKTDRKLIKQHLEQAKERNAFNLDFGDNFCAMQGRDDRRGMKKDVLPENQRNDYYDSLVETHSDFYAPYCECIAMIGKGNHEDSILARKETNLTKRLVDSLQRAGSPVVNGGFRGWVRLLFETDAGGGRQGLKLYYTHGGGGGGAVTKGVIATNRRATYLPDANIVVGGHIHEAWMLEMRRSRLSDQGKEYSDYQVHLAIPTYKEEFFGASSGYHHTNERPPKPMGAWWVRFYYRDGNILYEATRAR